MRRKTRRPDASYRLEATIEIADRIYEAPARSHETQPPQPSSSAPQSIVEGPEVAQRPSHDSGEPIPETEITPRIVIQPNLQFDPLDLELDETIDSVNYSRERWNFFRALRHWPRYITLKLRLVCS